MGDGIRTRDIQIHNLECDPRNQLDGMDVRRNTLAGAHYLPTDTCQMSPELAYVIAAWERLGEGDRAAIVEVVRSALDDSSSGHASP